MSSLVFNKAAAARLLPFATKIERIGICNGAINVIYLIKGRRCSTFLSKQAFYQDFVTFRRLGAAIVQVTPTRDHYLCSSEGSDGYARRTRHRTHTVVTTDLGINCSCEDYLAQYQQLGNATCKHCYAVLNHLGHSNLESYLEARAEDARLSIFPY